ncbi:50S ribosomal protein L31 [Mycoplasma crocodyli]|uniref:Large ribosomal subunit protein bL31 n=1 Tax=Mycoplasma crocodyli (strain ATCC 51981 / MP145) TaxID=512564 RepID=D5E5Z1_MYCCM|nr:50S ribosomal protein L31 [Mycoplasma crocodyli]ADE19758.1 50S ribosomal protein L31 [Mycoplasma crocodyli MP145]
MKKNIHPQYHVVQATCSTCQNKFEFGSTKKQFSVDVCSGCHPIYTGNKAQVKATGRVDRFNKRLEKKNK